MCIFPIPFCSVSSLLFKNSILFDFSPEGKFIQMNARPDSIEAYNYFTTRNLLMGIMQDPDKSGLAKNNFLNLNYIFRNRKK